MVELQIVILAVAGSSPVGHPTFPILFRARNYPLSEALAGFHLSGFLDAKQAGREFGSTPVPDKKEKAAQRSHP